MIPNLGDVVAASKCWLIYLGKDNKWHIWDEIKVGSKHTADMLLGFSEGTCDLIGTAKEVWLFNGNITRYRALSLAKQDYQSRLIGGKR